MSEQNKFNGDYLADIIKSISDTGGDMSDQSPKENVSEASSPPSSDLISAILSNPELLSKIPTIISNIKPLLELFGGNLSQKSESSSVSAVATQKEKNTDNGDRDRRIALLCAMKPYLGKDRRDAIDYIVKLSRLGDVLKSL